jgi:hypothetical protein
MTVLRIGLKFVLSRVDAQFRRDGLAMGIGAMDVASGENDPTVVSERRS